MAMLRSLPPEARRILKLSETDRAAARRILAALPTEAQVALVCETPVARRGELLSLVESPEQVIPALPPAELCFTAKAIGLADAGWVLEHATASQITTCIDLDAWRDLVPDRGRFGEWLAAFAEAGDETLLRAVRAVDFEVLLLHLQSRIDVVLKPQDDSWSPPDGAQTLDGQFFFVARSGDDLEEVIDLLRVLFESDYWVYFRLLQAVVWELQDETEEWALRWRSGRLQDLGFLPWEESMGIYGYLRPELLRELPERGEPAAVGEWPLPVWMPQLPAEAAVGDLLFRTLAALPDDERRSQLFAFIALANRVAVADRLPLGDAESLPLAIAKAARAASVGLEFLAREHRVEPIEVLRRAPLERLFRVGFHLDEGIEAPAPGEPSE